MNVIQKLKEMGYETVEESWYSYVDQWEKWYEGNVKGFHDYSVWNGQKRVAMHRYSLGMAKKVCEDWANLLMNEKVTITLEGEAEQEFVDQVFEENGFQTAMNELQERGAACGTYAIVPRVTKATVNAEGSIVEGGEIVLDYVTAEHIYPLSWTGHKIYECAFASIINADGKKFMYLQTHTLDESKKYVLQNYIYDVTNGSLMPAKFEDVPGYERVTDKPIRTGSEEPQFVIGRYNIVNNIDAENPMGISVYANAIDQIKGVDIVYDSYINEFVLGKKRVLVKPAATKNLDGENVFDPNDVCFYVLPEDMNDGEVIQPINMDLRTAAHQQGIQDQLNLLSAKCGFGEQHYRFDAGNVATATQIISENSTLFRTIKKHEILLEELLINFCRLLLRMGNAYLGRGLDEDVEISVDFDDSIIEDKATDQARIYQMLAAGLMRPEEARSLLMNEDIETAKAALPTMMEMTAGESQGEVE